MCGADRENGKTGFCGETGEIRAARAALHMGGALYFWKGRIRDGLFYGMYLKMCVLSEP